MSETSSRYLENSWPLFLHWANVAQNGITNWWNIGNGGFDHFGTVQHVVACRKNEMFCQATNQNLHMPQKVSDVTQDSSPETPISRSLIRYRVPCWIFWSAKIYRKVLKAPFLVASWCPVGFCKIRSSVRNHTLVVDDDQVNCRRANLTHDLGASGTGWARKRRTAWKYGTKVGQLQSAFVYGPDT